MTPVDPSVDNERNESALLEAGLVTADDAAVSEGPSESPSDSTASGDEAEPFAAVKSDQPSTQGDPYEAETPGDEAVDVGLPGDLQNSEEPVDSSETEITQPGDTEADDAPVSEDEIPVAPEISSAGDEGLGDGTALKLFFEELVVAMGVQATIRLREETAEQVTLDMVNCPDASLIIGRHGQTVDDLQYLGSLILNGSRRERKRFMLNVENYRERREESLRRSAVALARKVAEMREEAVLDPLPPHERRIVHLALQEMPDVYTYSEGEDPDRRIVISPREISPAPAASPNDEAVEMPEAEAAPPAPAEDAGMSDPETDSEMDSVETSGEFGLIAEQASEDLGIPVDDGDLPETTAGGGSHGGHTGED